jgi:type IV pilus assembly protein PilE
MDLSLPSYASKIMLRIVQESRARANARAPRIGGFTLIELMTTMAIVALLAAIAYPSYLSQMRKGRQSSAESALMDIAQREQQYLLDARSYAPDLPTLNYTVPPEVAPFYTIQICQTAASPCTAPTVPATTFFVVGTPIAGTVQESAATLVINNTGAKTPSSVW